MMTSLKAFALGLAITAPTTINYDPTVLVIDWPNGEHERIASTEPATCNAAIRAIDAGRWRDDDVRAWGLPTMHCEPGNLFVPGSEWIKGYNDPETRGRR